MDKLTTKQVRKLACAAATGWGCGLLVIRLFKISGTMICNGILNFIKEHNPLGYQLGMSWLDILLPRSHGKNAER